MLYCLLYELLQIPIEVLIVRGRGHAQLRVEVWRCHLCRNAFGVQFDWRPQALGRA
ncbi:MAG TPA: hypothetical protein VKF14_18120 [Candidatus Dormibacteraeota bacterium]|nr:hypothetical protein [Candidatus Dormibacteraeota bacterium]